MNNINGNALELAVLFGQPVLITYDRIQTALLPEGIHYYELRHSSGNPSKPTLIERNVQSDYYGSVLSKEPIELTSHKGVINATPSVGNKSIGDTDFRIDDYAMATIQQYLDNKFELTPEPETNIRVLIIEPLELPKETVIPNTLQAKQKIVEGLIEAVYPFEDSVALICNDEGKLIGLPLNRRVGSDIIAGTFIVCGLDDRNASFASLNDEQIKRYKEMFKTIEIYLPKGAIPVAESQHKRKRSSPER